MSERLASCKGGGSGRGRGRRVQVKSGLTLTPVPSDANKVGSKVTRHEEPGRGCERSSTSADLVLSLQRNHGQIMTLNTHLGPQILQLTAAAAAEGDLKSNEKISPCNHF